MNRYASLFLGVFVFATSVAQDKVENNSNVTIVSNATIYTSNPEQPTAAALAFAGNKILALDSQASLDRRYPGAKTLDLDGATVIPGLIDAHVHLLSLGQSLSRVDLVGSTDKQDILQRLVAFDKNLPEGDWLLGRGWDQNDWPVRELPSAADLDAAFPERPVWLNRIDGHAGWANSAALKFVTRDLAGAWQPEGGEIVRDSNGRATGIFIDNAESLIAGNIPTESDEQLRAALVKAMERTASVGLTSVHNAGTSKRVWDILQEMHAAAELGVRYYAMADGPQEMLDYLCDSGLIIDPTGMLTARAVKLYSDGALGSRGAALLAPYSDSPDNSGLLLVKPETLSKDAKRAAECGLQVNIHAIGDRGNRITLDALEAAQNSHNPGRHRNEHSQVVAPQDFERFRNLGVIASVQPTHATSDMYWAEQRVGPERIKGAYAWQTFLTMGIPLALGSDFPVERANPMLGFHAAVTRQDAKGWPEIGWYSDQKLSRVQALHGFTLGAAYAAFQENEIGSLEVGKYADFTVLSKDIMTIPAEQILDTRVIKTYLNGKAIYQQE